MIDILKDFLDKKGVDLNTKEIKQLENLISHESELIGEKSDQISAGVYANPKILKALLILGAVGLGTFAVKKGYDFYNNAAEEPHEPTRVRFDEMVVEQDYRPPDAPTEVQPVRQFWGKPKEDNKPLRSILKKKK